ncbi:MAG: ribose-5-phosphate isomerase RpiA [Ignavibacteriales bacterium]|jgi:ribose 5-phosphate isomerase|nr:Ribose-5-phosphate isomerase A [Ignavibacteriaceae bacterium]MCZ2142944.1 ribose-5-phosphate isomerase RpiA [Ignavibacteriales bacterium]WKZ73911.1 MAG: ribose-5-phosphate isomerase RpiA [Ignavibacteriaceae bacterium]
MIPTEVLKEQAALAALKFVKNGDTIGLGTGSTVKYAIDGLGNNLKNGTLSDIKAISTSLSSEARAKDNKIPTTSFDETVKLDVYIDGADEVDQALRLIKGGGGALLREKIVAQNSALKIIIVDASKLSERVGEKWHLPVEVFPLALGAELNFLKSLDAVARVRTDDKGEPFITDNGNFIIDANFGRIHKARKMAKMLDARAGIAGHGLFIDLCDILIVAYPNGVMHIRKGEKETFKNLLDSVSPAQTF